MILANNEIPELIRIGPLNHPAMIMDSNATENQKSQPISSTDAQ